MHIVSHEENGKWIEDYVERETVGASNQVDDAEAAIKQEHEDTRTAENAGFTARGPEKTFQEMMVAIRDSLSELASSDDGEDGEVEDEETEQCNLSEDDEPGWVMGTIAKIVQ